MALRLTDVNCTNSDVASMTLLNVFISATTAEHRIVERNTFNANDFIMRLRTEWNNDVKIELRLRFRSLYLSRASFKLSAMSIKMKMHLYSTL